MFFHTTGKSFASPCAGRKDDSGSALNTPFFIPSGDAGLVECLWVLLCTAGFEIFSFVVTDLGGNWYALLRTVPPPQPPRGFLLRIACCCGKCRCCGSGYGGSCGVAQRVGTALFPLIEHGLNGLHRRFFIQPENCFLRPALGAKTIQGVP